MDDKNERLLTVTGVTTRFKGLVAVDSVDMHIDRGEIIGMIGPNGAGKTTLFNNISGVLHPDEGTIHFLGKDISCTTSDKICHLGIGRTFQIVQPFVNLSVMENVMVGSFVRTNDVKKAREEAGRVLRLVGMYEMRDARGRGLSLQYLKRMEVARALATRPQLLLLDEVMAGLNPTEALDFVNTILRIRETGITILIIEHIIKAITTVSDRIYVLNQGKLIAEGTPEETMRHPEVIKSYLGEKKHA